MAFPWLKPLGFVVNKVVPVSFGLTVGVALGAIFLPLLNNYSAVTDAVELARGVAGMAVDTASEIDGAKVSSEAEITFHGIVADTITTAITPEVILAEKVTVVANIGKFVTKVGDLAVASATWSIQPVVRIVYSANFDALRAMLNDTNASAKQAALESRFSKINEKQAIIWVDRGMFLKAGISVQTLHLLSEDGSLFETQNIGGGLEGLVSTLKQIQGGDGQVNFSVQDAQEVMSDSTKLAYLTTIANSIEPANFAQSYTAYMASMNGGSTTDIDLIGGFKGPAIVENAVLELVGSQLESAVLDMGDPGRDIVNEANKQGKSGWDRATFFQVALDPGPDVKLTDGTRPDPVQTARESVIPLTAKGDVNAFLQAKIIASTGEAVFLIPK